MKEEWKKLKLWLDEAIPWTRHKHVNEIIWESYHPPILSVPIFDDPPWSHDFLTSQKIVWERVSTRPTMSLGDFANLKSTLTCLLSSSSSLAFGPSRRMLLPLKEGADMLHPIILPHLYISSSLIHPENGTSTNPGRVFSFIRIAKRMLWASNQTYLKPGGSEYLTI